MARSTNILCIDVGSTGVRLAEFAYPGDGIVLTTFQVAEYSEMLTESNRQLLITSAIRQALDNGEFTTDQCHISVSGQAAFMRFVKLPPVREEEARIQQIIRYEAEQNVPFPMNEVIWDYQLFSAGDDDQDLDVMFVVIKNEIVESVAKAVREAGLTIEVVDFAPASLYNVARANHVGENECSMVLNIGGRCTTLLFVDGNRFFARTIPIAGFSITQQVAKEFGISNEEAEALKRAHGFVALGGAYEEPESEVAATISKIVRNVMTRLHGEINRSISVYRAQQKGRKPSHLYLAGGSSGMMFTEHFFSEKLRMEVSYLNPFKIVTIGDALVSSLQDHAHLFSEVVGTGLRGLDELEVPVDINLVPESIKQSNRRKNRLPFLVAAVVVWLATLAFLWLIQSQISAAYKAAAEQDAQIVEDYNEKVKQIDEKLKKVNDMSRQVDDIRNTLELRYRWPGLLNAIQNAKPNDAWVTCIEQMEKPEIVSQSGEEDQSRPDEFSALFAGRTATPAKEEKKDEVEGELNWVKICGQAVFLPEVDENQEFSRPIFSPAQEEALVKIADLSSFGEIPNEQAVAKVRESLRVRKSPDTILAEQFLRVLSLQPEIYSVGSETQIVKFQKDSEFGNIEMFEIQLHLSQPIAREE